MTKFKPGYHLREIEKGVLGEFSKILEEIEEFQDAAAQDCIIMELCELADLYGALEAFIENRYGFEMSDLAKMASVTKRAFEAGDRV